MNHPPPLPARIVRQDNYGTMRAMMAEYQQRMCANPETAETETGDVLERLWRTTTAQRNNVEYGTVRHHPHTRMEFLNYLRLKHLERRKQILDHMHGSCRPNNPRAAWTVATLEQYIDYDPIYNQLKRQVNWFEQLLRRDTPPTESFVELLQSITGSADLSVRDEPTMLMKHLEWHLEHNNERPQDFYGLRMPRDIWSMFIQHHYHVESGPALDLLVEHFVYPRISMCLFHDETLVQRAIWFRHLNEIQAYDGNANQVADLFNEISGLFPTTIHDQWDTAIQALASEKQIDPANQTEFIPMLAAIVCNDRLNLRVHERLLQEYDQTDQVWTCVSQVMAHMGFERINRGTIGQ